MAVRKVSKDEIDMSKVPQRVLDRMKELDTDTFISIGHSVYAVGPMTREEFVPLFDKFVEVVTMLTKGSGDLSVIDVINLIRGNKDALRTLLETALSGADKRDLDKASIAQYIDALMSIYDVNFSSIPQLAGLSGIQLNKPVD